MLDSDGTPFAGLQLFAVPAGFTHFPDARELEDREGAGGLCADVAVADPEGHFPFPALGDGEYAVYRLPPIPIRPRPRSGPGPRRPGSSGRSPSPSLRWA